MEGRLTSAEYGRLFETFSRTAFRFEARRRYDSDEEREPFQSFVAGKPVDLKWLQPWLDHVAAFTRTGRRMRRVRLITTPPSDYSRFALWVTPHLEKAGDRIHYLDEGEARSLGFPLYDFWIIDSSILVKMHFSDDDRLRYVELQKNPGIVRRHIEVQRSALDHALSYNQYMSAHPSIRCTKE